ncbi:MAG: hypothetical protein IPM29_05185 [Planctomycetes bacterium]|nr:hypothetical protein [Planctomycetota bacterium]
MRPHLASPTALLTLALSCAAQGGPALTWAQGPTGASLDVLSVPAATPGATPSALLRNVTFVDLEITNRTLQRGLRSDVSRRVVRDGAAFVELPDGGSLHRYRRDGGQWHGFLWIARDGVARVVTELAGAGANGTDDPFADRIGVAFDGRHAALPLIAGGLLLARLDGGTYAGTGNALVRPAGLPANLEPTTLCPGRSVLICGTRDDRVWRIPYAAGAAPQDVTPANATAGDRLKGELAPSFDGTRVVFLHGPQRAFTMYLLGETGPAIALPPTPAKYEEPGYLPETPNGPRLLLDDTGDQLFYIDATIRDEAHVLDLSSYATTWVTGDPNFQPYIGIIVLPIATASTFVAGIGDPARFDVYATAAGVPTVANLTQTAGNVTAPWAPGGLVPRAIATTRDGTLLLEAQPSAGGPGGLVRFTPAGPLPVAVGTLGAPELGSGFDGGGDLRVETATGTRLLAGLDATLLADAPVGVSLAGTVVAPGGAFRAALAGLGPARALLLMLPGGMVVGVGAGAAAHAVALTSDGSLLLAGTDLTAFGPGGAATLASGPLALRILSGRIASLP